MATATDALLDRLLADRPQLHAWSDGRTASWAVSPEVLRYLYTLLAPSMQTLETGSGHTTVLFAIAGTAHTCITPQQGEAERIGAYCASAGIVASRLRFVHRSSDSALPDASLLPERLDLVFIDGAHRFPLPCIDFHYTESRIPPGGMFCLDDCALPSVRVLHDFLAGENDWRMAKAIGATVFFQRVRETKIVSDWQGQAMNRAFRRGGVMKRWLRRLRGLR